MALLYKWKVQSSRVKTGNIKKGGKKDGEKRLSWGQTVVSFCYLLSGSVGEVPPSCINWTSLIFMPSSLTSHVERLNRKPYNGEGPVPITRLT